MPRRVDVVLDDILDAITLIEGAVGARDFGAFAADAFLQRGVERSLEIISEAVRHLPDSLLNGWPELPWVDIRAIGNLLRHEYWRTDPAIIWSVIANDLPALRLAVVAMRGGFST
jgi:uncharacterized protein with HEPN domain